MNKFFFRALVRRPMPQANYRALISTVCSFAILMLPFAQIAAATRQRTELKHQQSTVRDQKSDGLNATTRNLFGTPTASPNVTATLTDNRPGTDPAISSPGDTVHYTAIISNNGGTATGVQFNDDVDANTAVVGGSVKMSPLALSDSYSGTLNTPLTVPAPGVLANDNGLPAPTAVAISGVATSQGGTFTLSTDGSFTYTPPNNFAGASDTFVYTATNSQAPPDTATVTITVPCQTITVTNPTNTNGTEGASFSETFTQSGAVGTATFMTTSTLPAGLTLSNTGLLSGTPTQTGTFPILVTATDSNGCTGTGATYNLTIGCQTITVTNPATTSGTEGAAFSQTFTQTGAIGSSTFALNSGTLPAGLTLSTSGLLSGTPTQTGLFPITVKITDSNGCTGTGATYNLTIGCQTITVTNPANTSGTVNAPYSETFTQSGAVGTATFTTASTLPAGLTLSTAGVLSGTPTQGGNFPIVVTVTDSNGCTGTDATYQLVVAKADQTISFTSTPPSNATVGGSTYTVTATATSGLTVAFTIDPSASTVCSISGSTVSFNDVGTCVINANQAGDGNYNAAPQVQQSFAVAAAPPPLAASHSTVSPHVHSLSASQKIRAGERSNHAREMERETQAAKSGIAPALVACSTTSTHVCVDVGTLPTGKSVTITFSVTVNSPYSGGANVSNQGIVSGNFSNVSTNDPDTAASNDATLTPVCTASSLVTNTNDSGDGSLRQAILSLCAGGGPITFDPALTSGGPATITLTSGELVINKNITITGPTNNGLTISGNNASRIFNVQSGKTLLISSLTIAHGLASQGGGILNGGTLTITNSTISGNTTSNGTDVGGSSNGGNGGDGGGIYNTGTLTLINSTVGADHTGRGGNTLDGASGNGGRGAAIYSSGTVRLTNTTITDNQSGKYGTINPNGPGITGVVVTGGIFNSGGTLILNNTIVANNRDGFNGENDISGAVDSSSSFNLIGTDIGFTGISNGSNGNQIGVSDTPLTPKLGMLGNNGGPTNTYLPLDGSPVINAGSNALARDQNNNSLTTDQRGTGFTRIIGGTVEIGSVETAAAPPSSGADVSATKSVDRDTVLPDRDLTYTITVTNNGTDPATDVTVHDTLPLYTTNSDPNNPTFATTTFVSITAPAGWSCSNTTTTADCSRTSLPGTSTQSITLVVHVPSNAVVNSGAPFISNSVVADASNDTNSENGNASATTQLFSCITDPVVTSSADSGTGSLRQAIADACSGSTITFDLTPGHVVSPISLTSSELVIDKNLRIQGPGANLLTVQRSTAGGTPNFRIFDVTLVSPGVVTFSGLTIANGNLSSGSNAGGILNNNTATVNVVNSTLSNNTAAFGGGILNLSTGVVNVVNSTLNLNTALNTGGGLYNNGTGTVNVVNSTLSGNSAGGGGGIFNVQGTVNVTNSTIASNQAPGGSGAGGGIYNNNIAPPLNLKNSIVAGNSAGNTGPDLVGTFNSQDYNLIGNTSGGTITGTTTHNINNTSANLGLLANYGGPTQTMRPLPGSPVINAGDPASLPADTYDVDGDSNTAEALPLDQRGFARVVGGNFDIGAVETNYIVSATAGTPQSTNVNTAFSTAFKVTVTESGTLLNALSVTFTAPGSGASGTFPGPSATAVVATNSSGVATAPTFTANGTGGSYNVIASIGAAPPTATFALTNNKLDQTINFGPIADKTFGNPDFTVTATATSSLAVSFGAVGNCTVSGTGTGTVHITGAGSCTITASQSGNATYNAAPSVPQSFNIAKAATTTAVTSSANPADLTQTVTFTATVTSTGGTPTGTVQFKDNGTNLGSGQPLNGSGVAQVSTSSLTAGMHIITADFSGDANFKTSSGTLSGGQVVGTVLVFSATIYNTTESSRIATITVQRLGNPSPAVTVDYATPDDSSAPAPILPCSTPGFVSSRCDFDAASGTLRFASGDLSKTFDVLISQDNFVEGTESVPLTLSNPTNGAALGSPSTANLVIADDSTEPAGNPIDDSTNFVRQHYHDFLNREPDAAGLNFWVNQIESCGADQGCRDVKRTNVSAAFYLSIEFQQTGYYVYLTDKTALGDINPPSVPVPVRYREFMRDTQEVGRGVIVGQGSWQAQLDANKQAYALAFVSRPSFLTRYPGSTTATAFVDALNANAGNVLTPSERTSHINGLSSNPSDPQLRANVLMMIAENSVLKQQQFNRAFVLMEYFGYLRRNPDAAPDSNFAGYNFWLNKLNTFNGDFVKSDMVKAFINSSEYRNRFGQ